MVVGAVPVVAVVGVVGDADPADITVVPVTHVEPAEAQPVLRGPELGEAVAVAGVRGLAFDEGLTGATGRPEYLSEASGGVFPQLVEPPVERGDVFLLFLELDIIAQSIPSAI